MQVLKWCGADAQVASFEKIMAAALQISADVLRFLYSS